MRCLPGSWVCSQSQNVRASRDAFPLLGFALNFRASRDAVSLLGFALILKTVAAVTTRDAEWEIRCACPYVKSWRKLRSSAIVYSQKVMTTQSLSIDG